MCIVSITYKHITCAWIQNSIRWWAGLSQWYFSILKIFAKQCGFQQLILFFTINRGASSITMRLWLKINKWFRSAPYPCCLQYAFEWGVRLRFPLQPACWAFFVLRRWGGFVWEYVECCNARNSHWLKIAWRQNGECMNAEPANHLYDFSIAYNHRGLKIIM